MKTYRWLRDCLGACVAIAALLGGVPPGLAADAGLAKLIRIGCPLNV